MTTHALDISEILKEAERDAKLLADGPDRKGELCHLINYSRLLVRYGHVADALWYSTRGLALCDAEYGSAQQLSLLMAIREFASKPESLEEFWRSQLQPQGD